MENQPITQPASPKKFPTSVAVLLAVVLTAVIAGGGVYFWQNMQLQRAENDLASVRQSSQQQIDDLKAKQSSAPASLAEQVASEIENWSLYKENPNVKVGAGKCGNQEFENFLNRANSGSRKTLVLNGLTLVITPNYDNWSNEEFMDFNNDNTAFCEVGGFYPLHAYPDELLWRGACSSGAGPEPGEPGYAEKVAALNQCQDTVNEISIFFSTLAAPKLTERKIESYLLFQDDTYRFRVTATAKTCADYYSIIAIEPLENSLRSYGIFAPGSKVWGTNFPASTCAIYTQAAYAKLPSGEMQSKPEIILRLDNGNLLTEWQPQDSPPDMPQGCQLNFEKF